VLDLARDPRWGRTEECYSEDPYLVSRIGLAAIYGLQGRSNIIDNKHVAVTLKHFAGHGQPEGGRNTAPVNYSEREFRETHLYPFEIAVKKGHAKSVMASYNEWDGVPNHLNHKLLTDILRNEWGFKGYVMTDGGGLDMVYQVHHAADDSADAGMLAIQAGVDYDLGSKGAYKELGQQIRDGRIPQESVDRAVRNVLHVKFIRGLFENPYIDVDFMEKITNCTEHKALALKAAQEALILLKNENNTLPFDSIKVKSIAVIGPNADSIHLGGYSPRPMIGVSVLEGIKAFTGNRIKVLYAEGCKITINKECNWLVTEPPAISDPETDKKLIAEAVKIARQSDAILLVLGENELINREAWSENHLGDRDNLDLAGMQNELVKAIISTGKPVAVLLINGRPISINYIQENAPAILEGWYLGQETGHAVADIIFGRVNPSGKLTVTFPRSVGQLPCYYDKKPSRHRNYVLADSGSLYPFGYGLSYTSFEYKNLKLSSKEIPVNGTLEVKADITNTGMRKGDEIVQLYIHDLVSLPTRPVKELKDFTRITLEPGETKTIKFLISPEKLEAMDIDMKRKVQPGDFEIMVGKSSEEVIVDTLKVVQDR
jgi:beta-glucosidase